MGAVSSGRGGSRRKRWTRPDVNISCAARGAGMSEDLWPWKVKMSIFHKLKGSLRKLPSGCAKVFRISWKNYIKEISLKHV